MLNVNNRTSFPMRGSRKFFQRGSNYDYVFLLLMMGEMFPNTNVSGSSSAQQRNAIKIAFRWWAVGGPTLKVCLVAV